MDARREKILIMEGEETVRLSLQELLQASGYEVLASGSCEEGQTIARTQAVDLVLLDTNLSGLICGDLVAGFKGASATANVRVILLTPGGPAERARSLDLGADDVVPRPWHEAEPALGSGCSCAINAYTSGIVLRPFQGRARTDGGLAVFGNTVG